MIDRIINHKYLVYFVASIIPLMSVSIFLADLFVTFLSLIFLIFIFKNKNIFYLKNIFFLLCLFFYFLCVLSSLASDHILFSLKSSIPLIRIIILILFISFLLEKKKNFSQILYDFMKYTFLFLLLFGLGSYLYEYFSLDQYSRNIVNIRLTLLFSDEQKLGSYLVRLYPLFLALFFVKKNKTPNEKIFFFSLTFLFSLVVFLTGERTALFFFILITILCIFFIQTNLRIKLILFSTIFISFVIIIIFNSNLTKRLFLDKFNQFNIKSDNIVIFTPHYTAHYMTAYKIFLDKPLIGHGPKVFRKICMKEKFNVIVSDFSFDDKLNKNVENFYNGCATHPHNTYMQLLAETGIVGFLLFLLGFVHLFFLLLSEFFKFIFSLERNLSNYQTCVAISALIVFWPLSPSGNFFNNWVSIMHAIPLGFYANAFFLKRGHS